MPLQAVWTQCSDVQYRTHRDPISSLPLLCIDTGAMGYGQRRMPPEKAMPLITCVWVSVIVPSGGSCISWVFHVAAATCVVAMIVLPQSMWPHEPHLRTAFCTNEIPGGPLTLMLAVLVNWGQREGAVPMSSEHGHCLCCVPSGPVFAPIPQVVHRQGHTFGQAPEVCLLPRSSKRTWKGPTHVLATQSSGVFGREWPPPHPASVQITARQTEGIVEPLSVLHRSLIGDTAERVAFAVSCADARCLAGCLAGG